MHGRSSISLLALSLLFLSPAFLCGQTNPPDHSIADHSTAGNSFQFQFERPSHLPLPPIELNNVPLHSPTSRPGTFGFTQLARAAGTIFSGTVTTVTRPPASLSAAIETVSITFHVEQAIRGARPGADLTISQWIGAWSGGQRYRAGERVLLFLYPPSKLGLTSCVGAGLGRFRFDSRGRVLLSPQQVSAFRENPALRGQSSVSFTDLAHAVQQAVPTLPGNAWPESEAP
jgi:hypothetical protein